MDNVGNTSIAKARQLVEEDRRDAACAWMCHVTASEAPVFIVLIMRSLIGALWALFAFLFP